MAGEVSLVLTLIAAAVLVVSALLGLPLLWRSKPHRTYVYLYLSLYMIWLVIILQQLFPRIGVSLAWQIGVQGVLLALALVALVRLFRHLRHPGPHVP